MKRVLKRHHRGRVRRRQLRSIYLTREEGTETFTGGDYHQQYQGSIYLTREEGTETAPPLLRQAWQLKFHLLDP